MARPLLGCILFPLVAVPLGAQGRPVELALGVAIPSSDLSQFARPGPFLELHLGPAPAVEGWGGRARFQFASYQPQQVKTVDPSGAVTYERRAASFTTAGELLTPTLGPGNPNLRVVFGLGLEAWRLTEIESRPYVSAFQPGLRTDNGYGLYFGSVATVGLRLEFSRQAHAEVRLEASKVAFVGVYEDRHFNAPLRMTASAGWRF